MYYIDFNNGLEMTGYSTLEDAVKDADNHASYTQLNIYICCSTNDNIIARRIWWSKPYDPLFDPDKNPICFGDLGFYSDWRYF